MKRKIKQKYNTKLESISIQSNFISDSIIVPFSDSLYRPSYRIFYFFVTPVFLKIIHHFEII